ncbi:MAG: VWA domain-containing protein [Saprospiraceae bacterium]|nr:VWA domain-containing protein [Saprospiraceae bacterium]
MLRISCLIICMFFGYISHAFSLKNTENQNPKIQLALLLDVSNSMDGLIDQAKAQLWKIVNELADMEQNGNPADIELSLYTFGDDRLLVKDGYIKQWNAFSSDLDLISQNLFALTTSGGEEYCGWTLADAVDDLNWTGRASDLQIIVIAGNESFAQGTKNYIESCKRSNQNNIIVNTIFCGHCPDGKSLFWEDAAIRGQGKYMCIDQDQQIEYIATPYDSLINDQNNKLNDTYIGYGAIGSKRKEMQLVQDDEASSFSSSNMTERVLSKSSRAYSNASWDILDLYNEDKEAVLKLEDKHLPEGLKGKSKKEKIDYLERLREERENIQRSIGSLSKDRTVFIEQYRLENSTTENSLDAVMLSLIRAQASKIGFSKKE